MKIVFSNTHKFKIFSWEGETPSKTLPRHAYGCDGIVSNLFLFGPTPLEKLDPALICCMGRIEIKLSFRA